ncbi:MAG TPA: vWA domain-containing protein [Longimicrobium sp.]|nr:vWA domain-containing protein [Longimicrobium sp.]
MPTETTVGFVLMLDSSYSMYDAISQVVIDAKAFVRQALPNDQFGVNQFNDTGTWVYPTGSSPTIVTVGPSLTETAQAAQAIQSSVVPAGGYTNLGAAIQLGNALIAQANTVGKGFVILSDGQWNTGPDPATVLGSTPPIYVAGLGPYLSQQMFQPLLSKNPNSKFYSQPNAYQMMQIFNDIRAVPPDVALTANALGSYSGSDYTLTPSTIAGDSDEAQFTVVWSDARCQYTSGYPSGYQVNVVLIDPSGRTSSATPTITGDGYCIFNLDGVQPGTWNTLVQYSVPQPVYGTMGGFQLDTQVNMEVAAPTMQAAGEPLRFTAQVTDEGQPVEGLTVRSHLTRPLLSVENALRTYADEMRTVRPDEAMLEQGASEDIARLAALRAARADQGDILATTQAFAIGEPDGDGGYAFEHADTHQAGPYSVRLHVTGVNPATGKSFSRTTSFSTLVGSAEDADAAATA